MKKTFATVLYLLSCLPVWPASGRSAEYAFFAYLEDPSAHSTLVAFSPNNYDPRPGSNHRVPSRQSLVADLHALRPAFDGLILYSYDKDVTPTIIEEASRQGYRAVLLSIWNPSSEEEIIGTAQLARQYHQQLALAIWVGNEGIAFGRYTFKDLRAAVSSMQHHLDPRLRVPLCTSEPLDEYVDNGLLEVGDFLCPNIHFVFEHPEKSPAEAAPWVRRLGMSLAMNANKPVLVKETGVPHGGEVARHVAKLLLASAVANVPSSKPTISSWRRHSSPGGSWPSWERTFPSIWTSVVSSLPRSACALPRSCDALGDQRLKQPLEDGRVEERLGSPVLPALRWLAQYGCVLT